MLKLPLPKSGLPQLFLIPRRYLVSGSRVLGIGSFWSSEIPWLLVDKVRVNGTIYDVDTTYYWTDPDFPHIDDANEAIARAERAGEKSPVEAYPDYLDYSNAEFAFNSDGFMIYFNSKINVDAIPSGAGLGRIPVTQLRTTR